MTEIERKALELCNEVQAERNHTGSPWNSPTILNEALYRAIEQHEAYKQEVSDAVEKHSEWCKSIGRQPPQLFEPFIIPKPIDPLVEALNDVLKYGEKEKYIPKILAEELRTALAERGGLIVWKD